MESAKRGQLADLELRHQRRPRCEDRIRGAKDTGQLLALAEEQARSLALGKIRLYTNEAMTENLASSPGMDTLRPTGLSKTGSTGCSSVNLLIDPNRGMCGYSAVDTDTLPASRG